MKPLRQIYRRRSAAGLVCTSPANDGTADLVIDDFGIVQVYPHLWEATSCPVDRGSHAP